MLKMVFRCFGICVVSQLIKSTRSIFDSVNTNNSYSTSLLSAVVVYHMQLQNRSAAPRILYFSHVYSSHAARPSSPSMLCSDLHQRETEAFSSHCAVADGEFHRAGDELQLTSKQKAAVALGGYHGIPGSEWRLLYHLHAGWILIAAERSGAVPAATALISAAQRLQDHWRRKVGLWCLKRKKTATVSPLLGHLMLIWALIYLHTDISVKATRK